MNGRLMVEQKSPNTALVDRYLTLVFKYKTRTDKCSSVPTKLMSKLLSSAYGYNIDNNTKQEDEVEFFGFYVDDDDISINDQNNLMNSKKAEIK